jgi:hypothetical protein
MSQIAAVPISSGTCQKGGNSDDLTVTRIQLEMASR